MGRALFWTSFLAIIVLLRHAVFEWQPYYGTCAQEYAFCIIAKSKDLSAIHPLWFPSFYFPLFLRLLPEALFLSPWFHVLAAIVFQALLLFGFIHLGRRFLGLSFYEAIWPYLLTLISIKAFYSLGMLERLPTPNPFYLEPIYDFRSWTFIFVWLFLWAIFSRKWAKAGLAFGLLFTAHPKFAVRFLALMMLSAGVWEIFFHHGKALTKSVVGSALKPLIKSGLVAVVVMLPTLLSMRATVARLAQLPQQGAGLLTPLGWLLKNEPDDWLLTYQDSSFIVSFAGLALGIALFLTFLSLLSSREKKIRIPLEILASATMSALIFYLMGLWFETRGLDLLPESVSLPVLLTRFWDQVWVVFVGAGFGLAGIFFKLVQWMMSRQTRVSYEAGVRAFTGAFILFYGVLTVYRIAGNDWEIVNAQPAKGAEWGFREVARDPGKDGAGLDYRGALRKARESFERNDEQEFLNMLSKMDVLYAHWQEQEAPMESPEAVNFRGLAFARSGKYARALEAFRKADVLYRSRGYVWEQGVLGPGSGAEVSVRFKPYFEICQWMKRHLTNRNGVINPPYLDNFISYSEQIAFWDSKIDGHLMYMLPAYHDQALVRLNALVGPGILEYYPGFTYGSVGVIGRARYLSLTEEQIQRLQQRYPQYDYFLTETSHKLSFEIVMKNEEFILYRITN